MEHLDEDLLAWAQTFDPEVKQFSDLRTAVSLLGMVQRISGNRYPYCENPQSNYECWKNGTTFIQAFSQHFRKDPPISVDDIVQFNQEKIINIVRLLKMAVEMKETESSAQIETEIPDYDSEKIGEDNILLIQRFIRMRRATKKYLNIKKREKHRESVATEIYDSEHSYVKGLEVLVKLYYEQLTFNAKTSPHPFVTMDDIHQLFSNIIEISSYNNELLSQLKERVDNWHTHQKLGDIFVTMAPFLSLYTFYCNNFEHSTEVLNKMRKKEAFEEFLTSCKNNPMSSGLPVDALLITPIQRVPRYILLLKDLLRHTDIENPDFSHLRAGIAAIEKQAVSVNQNITKYEAKNEVVLIQEKLTGDDVPNIISPSRYYLTEGSFRNCFLDTKKESENFYIFLFNDLLLATKKKSSSKHYKFKYAIRLKLNCARVKDLPDLGVLQNAFSLISVKKTLTLGCDTIEIKNEWMNTINKLLAVGVEQARSRTRKFDQPPELTEEGGVHNLTASIMGTKTVYDKESGQPFTCYIININTTEKNGLSYTIYRRYREFDALSKTLKKQYPDMEFIPLPKKHIIFNLSKDTVESRIIMLEIFLEDLLMKKNICNNSDFVIFLQPSDNYRTDEPKTLSTNKRATKLIQPEHLKQLEEMKKAEEKRKKKEEKDIKKETAKRASFRKRQAISALDLYIQNTNSITLQPTNFNDKRLSKMVDLTDNALQKLSSTLETNTQAKDVDANVQSNSVLSFISPRGSPSEDNSTESPYRKSKTGKALKPENKPNSNKSQTPPFIALSPPSLRKTASTPTEVNAPPKTLPVNIPIKEKTDNGIPSPISPRLVLPSSPPSRLPPKLPSKAKSTTNNSVPEKGPPIPPVKPKNNINLVPIDQNVPSIPSVPPPSLPKNNVDIPPPIPSIPPPQLPSKVDNDDLDLVPPLPSNPPPPERGPPIPPPKKGVYIP